jgi:hypothetical protein
MTEIDGIIPARPNLKASHQSPGVTNQALTYGEFSRLAKAKGWTAAYLAEQFRGKIESPTEFFHRVLDSRNAGCAIVYRSVIDFYLKKSAPLPAAGDPARNRCACGCDRPLFGRKKFATAYCRLKAYRRRSATGKSGVKKATENKRSSVINAPGAAVEGGWGRNDNS